MINVEFFDSGALLFHLNTGHTIGETVVPKCKILH